MPETDPHVDHGRLRRIYECSPHNEKPHRDPEVLRYFRHKCLITNNRVVADILSSAFDYQTTRSSVQRGIKMHNIRDPITEGAFADAFEGHEGTEAGQPHKLLCQRSEDSPTHPFDTDYYSPKLLGANKNKGNSEGTVQERPLTWPSNHPSQTDTTTTTSETTDFNLDPEREYIKAFPPSTYRLPKLDINNDPTREGLLVAPPHAVYSDDYPNRYLACGCETCDSRHYLDGDGGAPTDCDTPLPVTIAGARRIYAKTVGTEAVEYGGGSRQARARKKYKALMQADSAILATKGETPMKHSTMAANDAVTTVLISCRLSPTDDKDRLVTPYKLVNDCKDASAEARDALRKIAEEQDVWAFWWVCTSTDHWATPHWHVLIYVLDPNDELQTRDFRDVVYQFEDHAQFPASDAHFEDGDPTKPLAHGAVRVEHSPILADAKTLRQAHWGDDELPDRMVNSGEMQSCGAIYVGTQLPHFATRGRETKADHEGAAFFDVASDGRPISHGDRMKFRKDGSMGFYTFADITEVLYKDDEAEVST